MTATSSQQNPHTPALPVPLKSAHARRYQLLLMVTVLFGIVTLIFGALYLKQGLEWRNRAFLGFKLTPNLVVDGATPLNADTWQGINQGVKRGDWIVSLNGQDLFPQISDPDALTGADYHQARTRLHSLLNEMGQTSIARIGVVPIEACTVNMPVAGDGTCRLAYALEPYPDVDFIGNFIVPFVTGLLTLLIGGVIIWLRSYQFNAILASNICFSFALVLFGLFDVNTAHYLTPVWITATVVLACALMSTGIFFPQRLDLIYKQRLLTVLPTLFLIAIPVLLWLHANPPNLRFQIANQTFSLVFVGAVILTVGMIQQRRIAYSHIAHDQSTTVLIGILHAAIPLVIWIINQITHLLSQSSFVTFNTSTATPFAIVVPLSLAYAILQYRLFDTDRVLSQAITYMVMFTALTVGYFLLVFSVSLVVTQQSGNLTNTMIIGVIVLLVAVLFMPLRNYLQRHIDQIFYRTRHDYHDYIEIFTQQIARMNDVEKIVDEFRIQLRETLQPTHMFVFTPDRQTGDYVAMGNPPLTDIVFNKDSGIVHALHDNDQLIYLEKDREWPQVIRSERTRLGILNALIILGMRGSNQLNGFIIIGPPGSGKNRYEYEALFFVQSLVNQMAIVVERSQVVKSLERRVQELNILSQVSQAANFAIHFDDLLELISAQTSNLIPGDNFYIALRDGNAGPLYFAFFQEDEERYRERELIRWPVGQDLFSEVATTGQPLRVDDFVAAMQQRNAPLGADQPNNKGWMGVPLIVGSRTLGVMAVGTTKANERYGEDMLKMLTDISSLASTAIDKSRLFDETNKRARQLSALNEASQQLAEQLGDVDQLLQRIAQNAIRILETEASALLMVAQEENNELVLRAASPRIDPALIGSRYPIKTGILGEVLQTSKPFISNAPQQESRWEGEWLQEGANTKALLAVPLIANNQAFGVLEVLNKGRNEPFTDEDSNLLMTFVGQAAIAVENARLFQMTDQQLSARVEELQTLERIDVELNRSLDATRVAEITVRWAIAQSGATAGAVGLVTPDNKGLQIIAKYGYGDEEFPEGAEGGIWPLERGIVKRVLRTKQAEVSSDLSIDPDYIPSLRGAISQITVPMLSAGEINSLLILETNKAPRLTLVDLAFVQRLTEHASIALANAQLYAELTRANESKSEFVSFVAHELKTPMTSIKGFTDLLITGLAGEVNERQAGFLGTIKSNIERMNTLVSDLNDVTKLQTGNLTVEPNIVDFANIVTEALRPLQAPIEDKGQTLTLNQPDDMPKVYVDANRIIQVLTNLISNAHKYTPPQGDIIIHHEVVTEEGKSMLHTYVKDTGIGMSEEDVAKLFTPYFRSDNPLAREQPGTGLGLTITRGIIEQHGGRIWVESVLGEGTAFHFTVPVALEAEAVDE
jgi:signal transduction histidine kinase